MKGYAMFKNISVLILILGLSTKTYAFDDLVKSKPTSVIINNLQKFNDKLTEEQKEQITKLRDEEKITVEEASNDTHMISGDGVEEFIKAIGLDLKEEFITEKSNTEDSSEQENATENKNKAFLSPGETCCLISCGVVIGGAIATFIIIDANAVDPTQMCYSAFDSCFSGVLDKNAILSMDANSIMDYVNSCACDGMNHVTACASNATYTILSRTNVLFGDAYELTSYFCSLFNNKVNCVSYTGFSTVAQNISDLLYNCKDGLNYIYG